MPSGPKDGESKPTTTPSDRSHFAQYVKMYEEEEERQNQSDDDDSNVIPGDFNLFSSNSNYEGFVLEEKYDPPVHDGPDNDTPNPLVWKFVKSTPRISDRVSKANRDAY